MTFAGQLALITGAGNGIGRATALELAARGARIVATDIREDRVTRVAGELGEACVLSRAVDVADREAMATLAADVHADLGPLQLLVNNAGVTHAGGVTNTPLEDFDWLLAINLTGVVHGCHFFVPAMIEAGRGHVVNVSSLLGLFGAAHQLAYTTSKFAVVGFSESLRAELHGTGVGVSTICPSLIATDMITGMRVGAVDDEARLKDHLRRLIAARGVGPERVARAIVRAVEDDRAVVPVNPEAWLLYYLKRYAPALLPPLTRAISRITRHGAL